MVGSFKGLPRYHFAKTGRGVTYRFYIYRKKTHWAEKVTI
jgi:hypothetical protein